MEPGRKRTLYKYTNFSQILSRNINLKIPLIFAYALYPSYVDQRLEPKMHPIHVYTEKAFQDY